MSADVWTFRPRLQKWELKDSLGRRVGWVDLRSRQKAFGEGGVDFWVGAFEGEKQRGAKLIVGCSGFAPSVAEAKALIKAVRGVS